MPYTSLALASLLTSAESDEAIRTWNQTTRHYGPPRTLHALFLEQAQRTPGATALLEGARHVSYVELARQAGGMAATLRAAGAGPGAIVAICAERSAAQVAGLLGCLLAGAAYLPLDPAYPPARLTFMLQDSRAALLLTQRSLAERLPAFAGRTLWLEEIAPAAHVPTLEDVQTGATDGADTTDEADAAYVVYTSGSTGQPKGVVGLHRGAVNRLRWMAEQFPFTPEDVGVHKTALSYVDSVAEIFGPLLGGVPAVLLPQAVAQDGRALVQALQAGRVTRIVLVPSLLRALLDAWPDLQQRLPHLTLWVCSGEALPVELARRFARQMPHARLLNFYGSSEVSADVTWYDTADLPADAASAPITSAPIGKPLANTQIYVLDEAGEQVPVGVGGEIHVAGAHLAAGYLHQPELTAQRFPTRIIDGRGPVRLYATGDRGRWLPDGNLEYLGRGDDQVKVRGVRIELGEVRAALAAHPAVAQVEVITQEMAGELALGAYCVLRPGAAASVHDLRAFAAGRLPEPMLPATFVLLPAMPLTPNGKIDRLQLRQHSAPAAQDSGAPAAPRNEVEAKLIKLWETVLQRHPVGVHDNFFDLGGHSLAAMRLFVLIEQEFGVALPLASLLGEATVAQLAQLVASHPQPGNWQALVAVQPLGSRPPLYIVHGITGDVLWFRDLGRHLAPDQPVFGLQAPALAGDRAPFDSLPAMAASYLAEIRAHQRSGPYYLGGASFGGTVALEMAQQLTAQGEEVALLIQFDHGPLVEDENGGWSGRMQQAARNLRNAPRWLASLGEMQRGALAARARRKLNNAWQELAQVTRPAETPPVQAADLIDYADQLPPHRQRLIESHHQAAAAYTAGPYQGPVLLLLAQVQPLFSTSDAAAQWRRLASDQLQVRTVPGSHEGMFHEPHVQQLARHIRQAMERGAV